MCIFHRRGRIEKVAEEIAGESGGKFTFEVIDPDAQDSPLTRETLSQSWGLQPFAVSLFSPDTYYLHLILQIGPEAQLLYPGGEMSETDLRVEIESALKRAAPGFLKTVGLRTPPAELVPDPFRGVTQPLSSWQMVREQLAQNYTVKSVDLSSGRVPGDVEMKTVALNSARVRTTRGRCRASPPARRSTRTPSARCSRGSARCVCYAR